MGDTEDPGGRGSLAFFGLWLLLHEKADDWIREAIRRARETPEEVRTEYQDFLLAVEREKEKLKGVFGEAVRNQLQAMGFVDRDEAERLRAEVEELRDRLRALEERVERVMGRAP